MKISNQSGVGRGLITPREMDAVQRGYPDGTRVGIADSYVSVHRTYDGCHCRKILRGRNARSQTIWLSNPLSPVVEGFTDFMARNWPEAQKILAQNASS